MARPTKLTPETTAKLVEAIRLCASYKVACQYAGVHYDTFRDWMQRGRQARSGKFSAFSASIERALAEAELSRYAVLHAAAKTDWRAADAALGRIQRARERIEEADGSAAGGKLVRRVTLTWRDFVSGDSDPYSDS